MYLEFISANWYLFAMLAVIVLLLTLNPTSGGGAAKISPLELPRLQNREAAVVVDARAAEDFKRGHIARAVNLPLNQIADKIAKLNKHKGKPIIIACQNGGLSGKAAAILRRNEFSRLYILDGGLAAWKKENLPLVKG